VYNLVDGFDVYEMGNGILLHLLKQEHLESVQLPCVLAHGDSALVTGSSIGTIRIWDLESGEKLSSIVHHDLSVNGIADNSLPIKMLAVCIFDSSFGVCLILSPVTYICAWHLGLHRGCF
jgi:WD40 repeat protein